MLTNVDQRVSDATIALAAGNWGGALALLQQASSWDGRARATRLYPTAEGLDLIRKKGTR